MEITGLEQPVVSIIVPARNEESSLPACLQSLVMQSGIAFEVIVVDDGSTDRTRAIAESYPGVHVMSAPPLPSGWTGKNNAVAAGAQQARGELLLFTDADTVHLPGSLRRGVLEAQDKGVALLSYSPKQIVQGFWQRAVMPVIFAELASTYRPKEVSNPASPAAAANGQYLLISREAYDAAGGHAAVASDLLEDVALARNVKRSGRTILFRYGADAVRTRMYRSFSQMREGWTKNLALLFPTAVRLALLRSAEFLFLAGGAVATVALIASHKTLAAVLAGLLTMAACSMFVKRVRKAHFSWSSNFLAVLGLPLFAYLLLRSKLSYKYGNVCWKGRAYRPGKPAVEGASSSNVANATGQACGS